MCVCVCLSVLAGACLSVGLCVGGCVCVCVCVRLLTVRLPTLGKAIDYQLITVAHVIKTRKFHLTTANTAGKLGHDDPETVW